MPARKAVVNEKDAAVFAEAERRQAALLEEEDDDRVIGGYLFIPVALRHDFKRITENYEATLAVKNSRYARSARLFYHSNQSLRENLYPEEIEDMIGARMYYERALAKLEEIESKAFSKTFIQVQRQIVSLIERSIKNGQCDVYMGLLQPKRTHLLYSACSKHSTMLHKTLQSTEGISFRSINDGVVVTCDDIERDDEVKSFGPYRCGPFATFPLVAKSKRSTLIIGVIGIDSCRIAWRHHPQAMTIQQVIDFLHAFGLDDCVGAIKKHHIDGKALLALNETDIEYRLGIYRVNSRSKLIELIAGLRDGIQLHVTSAPIYFTQEPPSMEFIRQVAERAGELLHQTRLKDWHRILCDRTKDGGCTQYDIYNLVIQAILHCVVSIDNVTVWRLEGHRKFPPKPQIHVLAACDLPPDRIAPFVNNYERGMKRLTLYKEGTKGGSMIRGNISRIGTQDNISPFQITWADHSTDDFTWKELEPLLSIRPLNIQHFHVQKVLHAKGDAPEVLVQVDGDTKKWVVEFTDNESYTYAMEIAGHAPKEASATFVHLLLPSMEEALKCVRGRQRRAFQRIESTKYMKKSIAHLSMNPSADALKSASEIIKSIAEQIYQCLPGVEIAIAELLPGGTSVKFTFSFNGSTLEGRTIQHGVSLDGLHAPWTPQVIRNFETLRRLGKEESSDEALPYIFLPLVYDDAAVGFLSINRFKDVEKGREDELHPEYGVMRYLECAAKCIATVLRLKRRSHLIYSLESIAKNAFASPLEAYTATLRSMTAAFVGLQKARLFAIAKSSSKPLIILDRHDLDPLVVDLIEGLRAARMSETILSTFQSYHKISEEVMQQINPLLSDPSPLPLAYATLSERSASLHVDRKLKGVLESAFQVVFGNQSFVHSMVPALCTADAVVVLAYTANSDEWLNRGDAKYLDILAHSLDSLVQTIHGRYDRVRSRTAALVAIRDFISFRSELQLPLPSAQDELDAEIRPDIQRYVVDVIAATLTGSYVYVGMVEPSRKRITFTCASAGSVMATKHLKEGKGVSYHCLQSQIPLVIDAANCEDYGGVRFFSDPKKQEWPFIVVPIGRIGVLAIDTLQYGETPSPEMGIVDFLTRIAKEIEDTVMNTRAKTLAYRTLLRERAVQTIKSLCDDGKHSEIHVLKTLVDLVASTWTGVCAYVVLVEPWSEKMVVFLSSNLSCMQGNTISMVQSVSAACFRQQHPVIIPQVEKCSNGLILFDPMQTGPFVAVPIPYVGIISVDSFPSPAGGKYMQNVPEPGVISSLSALAITVGENIRSKRLWGLTRELQGLFHGNASTFSLLFGSVAELLAQNIVSAIRIDVWYVYHDHCPTLEFSKSSTTHGSADNEWVKTLQEIHGRVAPYLSDGHLVCPFELIDPHHAYQQTHALLVVNRLPLIDWGYDLFVLESIQPLLNDCFRHVSQRAAAAVMRGECLERMDMAIEEIYQTPIEISYAKLYYTQQAWLNWMAHAMGKGTDVYMGEIRAKSCSKHERDVLEFTCASMESLMKGTELMDESLYSFQVIRMQEPIVINHLTDTSRAVKFFTKRKAVRAYCAVPLSTFGTLAADSFGSTSFTTKNELEPATIKFLQSCSGRLVRLLDTTRHFYSFFEIEQAAKKASTRQLQHVLAQTIVAIQRNIAFIHCQQVLTLANDFTGEFTIESWNKSPTRRPIHSTPHFCYLHRCPQSMVRQHVHFDSQKLPMTNLPKTLDEARTNLIPSNEICIATGIEPRGAHPCFAGMIDSPFNSPKIALCVFRKPNRPFQSRDVRYLKLCMAVVQKTYVNTFKQLVVQSLAIEALHWAKDFTHAKDGLVVRACDGGRIEVVFATNPEKFPLGKMKSTLKKKTRLASFASQDVDQCTISLIPTAPVHSTAALTSHAEIIPTTPSTAITPVAGKPQKFKLFGGKKPNDVIAIEPVAKASPTTTAPPSSQHWEWTWQTPANEIVLLDITSHSPLNDDLLKSEGKTLSGVCHNIYDDFWKAPRGDEVLVGFFLSQWWARTRMALGGVRLQIEQQVRVLLEAEIVNKSICNQGTYNVLSAALLCCSYKKEDFATKRTALQLFLSKQSGQEIFELNPFDLTTKAKVWTAAFRSRAYLLALPIAPASFIHELTPSLRTLLDMTLLLQVISKWLKTDSDNEKVKWVPLARAALRIQCRARCNAARAELAKRRRNYKAAVVIQCFVRQTLAIRKVHTMRRDRAASRIQRWYRKRHEKKPAFATKNLLAHMHAIQSRFGAIDRPDEPAGLFSEETFEAFLGKGGRKIVNTEAKRLLSKMKAMAKERLSLSWEERITEEVRDVFEEDTKTLIMKLRIPLQPAEVDDVVNMIDSDRSGDVDMVEFCNWYKYEYARLRARSKDCGTMSKIDKEWYANGMAMRFTRQRWTAWRNTISSASQVVKSPASPDNAPPTAREVQGEEDGDEDSDVDDDDDDDEDEESDDEKNHSVDQEM